MNLQGFELGLHNAATWYMTGVIWVIQLVHYPMFQMLDRERFQASHTFHSGAIGLVVMPAMLLEIALAALLLIRRGPANLPALAGFVLVVILWGLTFFVMVPLHGRLGSEGFQTGLIDSLVRWNWLRTAAWSARAVLAVVYFRS